MTTTQERLLATLVELSKLCPDLRIGQTVCILTERVKYDAAQKEAADNVWEIEDDELLASAEQFLANRRQAHQTSLNEPAA